jgi:F-type H+-transporting ATPase subunit alpha
LLARVKSSNPGLLEGIRTKKDLTAELEAELKSVLEAFTKTFA